MLLSIVCALFYITAIGAAADHALDDTIIRTRAFMFDIEKRHTQVPAPAEGSYVWLHWSHENKHLIRGMGEVTDEKLILLHKGKEKEIAIHKQVPDCKIRGAALSLQGHIAIAWEKMNHENTINVSLFHLMGLKNSIVIDDVTKHEVSALRVLLRKVDGRDVPLSVYTLSFANMLFTPNGSHLCAYLPMKYVGEMFIHNALKQEPERPHFWEYAMPEKDTASGSYERALDALFASR